MSEKLGEILVEEQLVSSEQLNQALEHQRVRGGRLGKALVDLGLLLDSQLAGALARQYGMPSVDLSQIPIDPDVARLIPAETAVKYQVVPLARTGSILTLAMVDPTNVFAMDQIKFITGFNVEPVVASEAAVLEAIDKSFGSVEDAERKKEIDDLVSFIDEEQADSVELEAEAEENLDLQSLERAAEEAPVIRLVNYILTDAVKRGASDIHMEPYEKDYRIRFRIDGLLQIVMHPPTKLRDAIISRVKIMAKLDISEKRLPQDGRIMIRVALGNKKKQLDFRVSVLPTLHGEKIVMRLLDKESLRLDMTKLGFEPESLAKFQKAIFKPYGIVLVTGPTGSGKTNTLYSAIVQLNKPDTNILTAEIAIKAALTGHLVLSTLHTNDAPSTVSRLMNMGIEPFLVATSVNLIAAQRLVRRVCPQCKTPDEVSPQVLADAGFTPEEAATVLTYKGRGCNTCANRGYKGRIGLYEVMEITEELRNLILVGASSLELKRKAVEEGMISLRRSGLMKVAAGLTTLEEVIRETVL